MPRHSKAHTLISDAALGSLLGLGNRLKQARLRRNWTQALTATKAGLSESSVKKVESGSPRISVSAYLSLLDVYGLPMAFDQILPPGSDDLGEALSRSSLRQRARQPGQTQNADEWEL